MNKEEEFKNRLLEIEQKYFSYFEARESKFKEYEEHDRLHNHWVSKQEGGFIKFGFCYDSELPDYIRKECSEVFEEIFG
ncbi:MAG: hypothetical protein JXR61_03160 [Prolixibacteraceae bacterium]|nr:hypothetical protein [Prolixibacteraceae bacterium]